MIAGRAPGIVVFVGATFVLTCLSMHVLAGAPMATTVWRATLAYVLAVGWQPFAAVCIVRRTVDALPTGHADREAPRSYMRLAIALPLFLIAGAVVVQAALGPPAGALNPAPCSTRGARCGRSIADTSAPPSTPIARNPRPAPGSDSGSLR